jgi:hypothetical protein
VVTDKGRALWPVVNAIRERGDEWVLGAGNEPILVEHRTCGQVTHTRLVCDCCGEALDARSVKAIAGPGAGG